MADLRLSVKVDIGELAERFGDLAGARLVQTLAEGLGEAAFVAVAAADERYAASGLRRPTGTLAGEIQPVPDASAEDGLRIGVGVPADSPAAKYAHLLEDGVKEILPVKGRYLSIPIGAALTPAGVPRINSPREVEDGFFRRIGGDLFFGIREYDGKFAAMFLLRRRVTVKGRDILGPAVRESAGAMAAVIQERVDALIAEGRVMPSVATLFVDKLRDAVAAAGGGGKYRPVLRWVPLHEMKERDVAIVPVRLRQQTPLPAAQRRLELTLAVNLGSKIVSASGADGHGVERLLDDSMELYQALWLTGAQLPAGVEDVRRSELDYWWLRFDAGSPAGAFCTIDVRWVE